MNKNIFQNQIKKTQSIFYILDTFSKYEVLPLSNNSFFIIDIAVLRTGILRIIHPYYTNYQLKFLFNIYVINMFKIV